MTDLANSSSIEKALVLWLYEVAPFGVLVTDLELKIVYTNAWFNRSADVDGLVGRSVFDAFPDLLDRGFDRYYQVALSGQSRILSHRFHRYLFPMAAGGGYDFAQMQQSGRISPLVLDSEVAGTISVIEDVSERVAREAGLNFQIEERERLVKSEISARKLAEENERLKGSFDALRLEGLQLAELGRHRDKLMHRIIESQEEERKRVARDIHDHLGQQLTALRFALSLLKQQHADGSNVGGTIETAHSIAHSLDAELDYIAWNLRPAAIDDIGLEETLRTFIRDWSEHYDLPADFNSFGFGDVRLAPDVEINLYRIAQESLNNVSKHAGASRASVLLENRENDVVLIIEDNGIGFDVAETERTSALEKGMGLFGMRERAALVGGSLEIESAHGRGTSVYAKVPAASAQNKITTSGSSGAADGVTSDSY